MIMLAKRQLYFSVLFISLIWVAAAAQDQTTTTAQTPPEFNLIINRKFVRFAAPIQVQEWRVEVYNQTGELIFASGPQASAELDWPLLDQNGKPVESGLYAYTLTIKDQTSEGSHVQRGHVIVNRASDTDRVWVTSDRTVGIGAGGGGDKLTVAGTSETTVGGADVSEAAGENSVNTPASPEKASRTAMTAAADGSGTPERIAKWIGSTALGNSVIAEYNGNIGIGTSVPNSKLQVSTSIGDGVNSITYVGGSAAGVRGINFNSGNGVAGQSASGIGVRGDSTSGTGVYGFTSNGIAGVYGVHNGSSNNIGVRGDSASGFGVAGYTTSGVGVFGSGGSGDGIYGLTSGGSAAGVRGSTSGSGNGVAGNSNKGIGVRGDSTSGTGVHGLTGNGIAGVLGQHTGSGPGVLGQSSSGFAMRAEGNVQQLRDKGGWVKAIFRKDAAGNLTCFRGDEVAGAAAANTCNDFHFLFSDLEGVSNIAFPFKVNDRFIVVTPEWADENSTATATVSFIGANGISVKTWTIAPGSTPTRTPMGFTLLVF
jgi:hypothetical protein